MIERKRRTVVEQVDELFRSKLKEINESKKKKKTKDTLVKTVRRNINFLEYPMWIPSSFIAGERFSMEHYSIGMGNDNKVPTARDIDVLNYILGKIQMGGAGQTELTFRSEYQLMKELGLPLNAQEYTRLEESLDKWCGMIMAYRPRTFYETETGKQKSDVRVKILRDFSHKPNSHLEISFDPHFLKLNEATFSMELPIPTMRDIKNPYAKRLFEILYKSFRSQSSWPISIEKLVGKMPMHYTRPSVIIKIIEKSIIQINSAMKKNHSEYRYEFLEANDIITFSREYKGPDLDEHSDDEDTISDDEET